MTRPEEPADGRSIPPPADPWATIDRPVPTVYLGDPDTTVNVGPPDRTAHLPGQHPTVDAGPPDRTVHLPGQHPTVDAGPPDRTVHLPGQHPTAHVTPAGPAANITPNAPTVRVTPTAYVSPTAPAVYGSPTAPAGHQSESAPTVRADAELRFGPGVPAAPVAAPAWPAGRPRPLWRRIVSGLSSLLTLALVVVVGFYVWQRLSPLVVEGVTVAVPQPAGNRCDVTVDVVATVRTNGRSGVIEYQWFRSDASPGTMLTEQVGSGQRTATLTLKWTFSGVGTTTGTATVNIVGPTPFQAGTPVTYRCRRG